MITPAQIIAKADTHLGYEYGYQDRCGGSRHMHDCSGYICWVANELGIGIGCTSSFQIADLCWRNGLITTIARARATQGAMLIRGPNGGRGPSQKPNGSDGHIVWSAGDGTTREAMGHAYGVRIGQVDGRVWTVGALFPGVDYTPASAAAGKDQTMILQPGREGKPKGRTAGALISDDGQWVLLINGASLSGDQATGDSTTRRWRPRASGPIIGIAERVPNPKKGIVVALGDGSTYDGYWS